MRLFRRSQTRINLPRWQLSGNHRKRAPTTGPEVAAVAPTMVLGEEERKIIRVSAGTRQETPNIHRYLTAWQTKCVTVIIATGRKLGTVWPPSHAHGKTRSTPDNEALTSLAREIILVQRQDQQKLITVTCSRALIQWKYKVNSEFLHSSIVL